VYGQEGTDRGKLLRIEHHCICIVSYLYRDIVTVDKIVEGAYEQAKDDEGEQCFCEWIHKKLLIN